jgi:hypothetical protein
MTGINFKRCSRYRRIWTFQVTQLHPDLTVNFFDIWQKWWISTKHQYFTKMKLRCNIAKSFDKWLFIEINLEKSKKFALNFLNRIIFFCWNSLFILYDLQLLFWIQGRFNKCCNLIPNKTFHRWVVAFYCQVFFLMKQ